MTVATITALYAVIVATVALSWAPVEQHYPVGLLNASNVMRTFFPQGWAFFTRDPQLDRSTPFALTDGAWTDVSRGRNAQFGYFLGFNRESRLSELDSSDVLALLPEDFEWHECERDQSADRCINKAEVLEAVAQRIDQPLCGEVAIIMRQPVPFAYGTRVSEMPGRVARLDISCQHGGLPLAQTRVFPTTNAIISTTPFTRRLGLARSLLALSTLLTQVFTPTSALFLRTDSNPGGDHINVMITAILIPIVLCDRRITHWHTDVDYESRGIVTKAVAHVGLTIVSVQMAFLYLVASLSKINVAEWADGTALWYWLSDPSFGIDSALFSPLAPLFSNIAVLATLTYSMMALELVGALALVLTRRARHVIFVLLIAFHAVIAIVMGLWTFGFSMAAGLILYLIRPGEHLDFSWLRVEQPSRTTTDEII